MQRYYFNLVQPPYFERDETGLCFSSLEEAYLDTWRATAEMCVEAIWRR